MRVMALDYGAARTGVAVSDATGTLARPLTVVERAGTEAGFRQLVALIEAEQPARIVVGLPLTLRGERGSQAEETDRFVDALRSATSVPVDSFDERFTTTLASRDPASKTPEDARAAAHLLGAYLASTAAR